MEVELDPIVEWLLCGDHPAVRHATLTTLLGRSPEDPEVQEAQAAAMRSAPIRTILDCQDSGGHWARAARFYTRKYRGTVWQVIFLSQLGADGRDEGIRRACEFLFRRSQNADTGSFSVSSNRGQSGGGKNSFPCLTGNLVRAMLHFGYGDDPRWQRAVEWLVDHQQDDGGWGHGGHGCFQGSIKPLVALTAIPPQRSNVAIENAIERAAAFFVRHRLFRRNHHEFDVAKKGHLRLRFPLAWQTDVLEMLDGVTAAGITEDPGIADALAVVFCKRRPDGRWGRDVTFPTSGTASMLCPLEPTGKPSKWVTLRVLRLIARVGLAAAERLAAQGTTAGNPSDG